MASVGHRPQGLMSDALQQVRGTIHSDATQFMRRLNPDTIVRVHCGKEGETPPRFVTAYWSTRGIGAAIRMLLAWSSIPHWVLLYDVLDGVHGSWDKESWVKDKAWLSEEVSPLINLPYLIDLKECGSDGNLPTVIVHSNAILSFLDRTVLRSHDAKSLSVMEQLLCEVMDLRDAMISFAYRPATDNSELSNDGRKLLFTTAWPLLQRLERYLDNRYDWKNERTLYLVDERISAPDFHLFEVLDQFNGLSYLIIGGDGVLFGQASRYPRLSQFYFLVKHAESMQAYFSSDLYKLPYNNPYARFGSVPAMTVHRYSTGQAAPWRALGLLDV